MPPSYGLQAYRIYARAHLCRSPIFHLKITVNKLLIIQATMLNNFFNMEIECMLDRGSLLSFSLPTKDKMLMTWSPKKSRPIT